MRAILWVLFLINVFISLPAKAGDAVYPVFTISEDLKKNADAIVRLHEEEFIVLSPSKGIKRVRYVVTILNKNAKDHAHMYVPYDQLSKVKKFEGVVYNALGAKVGKLKKKDIEDMSNTGGSLFADDRVKAASLEKNEYPYTVEWTYEWETKNMMFYPRWIPQSEEKLAIEKATLRVEVPAGMKLRYIANETAPLCQESMQQDKSVYFWEVKNLPAIQVEPLSPSFLEYVPAVYTAPNEFEVDGYAGSMESWKSYGDWINLLNKNQNDLPESAVLKVQQLTSKLSTNEEKIRAVYDYLQSNTRYVSIQLGIGGWQPFKSSFVYNKGYGDCKALSFYTKSLLEAINIPSYYTLITAGPKKIEVRDDFPMSTFNHVILCVPNGLDTIWLECTSQTNPFNYLGNFTSDRKAVVITEGGGKVVRTPTYTQEVNLQNTVAHIKPKGEQAATVELVRSYGGLQFENMGLSHYINEGPEEQRKWIYKAIPIPSYEIQDFSFSLEEKSVPVVEMKSELLIRNFVSRSGKRSFINLNIANQMEVGLPLLKERKKDFQLKTPFIDTDTIYYYLTEGAEVEYLPEDVELNSEFGVYTATARLEEGKIVYTRVLKKNSGRFPAEKYNEYVKFRQEISKLDKVKAVVLHP